MKVKYVKLSPTDTIPKDASVLRRTKWGIVGSGAECMFIQLNEKHGIKIYRSKRNAEFAHKWQKFGNKHRIAPRVYGDVFKCHHPCMPGYGWAYITHVAKRPTIKQWTRNERKLSQQMDRVGIDRGDFRRDNCGMLNTKLVYIDFGRLSIAYI